MACPMFSSAAPSPLPGEYRILQALADSVREWAKTYAGEKSVHSRESTQQPDLWCKSDSVGKQRAMTADENEVKLDTSARDKVALACTSNITKAHSHQVGDGGAGTGTSEGRNGQLRSNDDGNDPDSVPVAGGGSASHGSGMGKKGEGGFEGSGKHGRGKQDDGGGGGSSFSSKSLMETCWETGRFALEMQAPWSRHLLEGSKTIETRSYPLPAGLVGRPIEIIESQPGQAGMSSVGDSVEPGALGLSVVGCVTFSSSDAYETREAWVADRDRHLVPPSSGAYGWKGPGSVHGWVVGEMKPYGKARPVRRMTRRFRSLFEVHGKGSAGRDAHSVNSRTSGISSKGRRNKKRRNNSEVEVGSSAHAAHGENLGVSSAAKSPSDSSDALGRTRKQSDGAEASRGNASRSKKRKKKKA